MNQHHDQAHDQTQPSETAFKTELTAATTVPASRAVPADAPRMPDYPELSEEYLPPPRTRRVITPIVLFAVTCLATFWAGATDWTPFEYTESAISRRLAIISNWQQGLVYMGCVLAILLCHEMGHFLATLRYRIPASLPFFIPFPFVSHIGTMGAVIGMAGYRANRRQMFDIGIAGPLAGLAVALPVLWIGIVNLDLSQPKYGAFAFDCPWLVKIMFNLLRPEYADVKQIWISQLNPYYMAAWVGLLITGLNMLPISQLDGGHVIYALFLKRGHWVARAFLILALSYIIIARAYVWTLMVVLITLIGTDHPPTANDRIPLGWFRTTLGLLSLAIPVLCFPRRGFIPFF